MNKLGLLWLVLRENESRERILPQDDDLEKKRLDLEVKNLFLALLGCSRP